MCAPASPTGVNGVTPTHTTQDYPHTWTGNCSRWSTDSCPCVPAPQQGGTQGLFKINLTGFAGRPLSEHQISAGALCNLLTKKPLLLLSFPPKHEIYNKFHRQDPQLKQMTKVSSLLMQMSLFTSVKDRPYMFLFQFTFYDLHLLYLHLVCLCGWCLVFIIFNCISDYLLYGFVHILLFHEILIKHLATDFPNWILMFSAANYVAGFKVSSIM